MAFICLANYYLFITALNLMIFIIKYTLHLLNFPLLLHIPKYHPIISIESFDGETVVQADQQFLQAQFQYYQVS